MVYHTYSAWIWGFDSQFSSVRACGLAVKLSKLFYVSLTIPLRFLAILFNLFFLTIPDEIQILW